MVDVTVNVPKGKCADKLAARFQEIEPRWEKSKKRGSGRKFRRSRARQWWRMSDRIGDDVIALALAQASPPDPTEPPSRLSLFAHDVSNWVDHIITDAKHI